MMTQTLDTMKGFADLLLTFWSDFSVLCFVVNKPFTLFLGTELLDFVRETTKIVIYLRKNFRETDALNDLCKGLELWESITPFLVITTINNKTKYNNEIIKFNLNLKQFYNIGARTFLTRNPFHVGDKKTFYMHCLQFYIPKIVEET